MRLPSEIAAEAGCGLSLEFRHCPYAIDDIACLRLDLISDSCSSYLSCVLILYYFKIFLILFQNDP